MISKKTPTFAGVFSLRAKKIPTVWEFRLLCA
ncbi:MAG: hypothetical protein ACD_78C00216G0007, partial [uncultured bacterium (gcode 4)]